MDMDMDMDIGATQPAYAPPSPAYLYGDEDDFVSGEEDPPSPTSLLRDLQQTPPASPHLL